MNRSCPYFIAITFFLISLVLGLGVNYGIAKLAPAEQATLYHIIYNFLFTFFTAIILFYLIKTNQALQAERENIKFGALIEGCTNVILLADENLCINYVSPNIKAVLGYEPEEIIHQHISSLVHAEDSALVVEKSGEVMENPGKFVHLEFKSWHKSRHPEWLKATAINRLGDPDVKAIIVNLSVITARKKFEEDLKFKIKELNTFIYRASHDLRGPLSSIIGLTEAAKHDIKDPVVLSYFKMISISTSRLDKILLNLIDLARITPASLTKVKINFQALIDDVLRGLKNIEGFSGVTINLNIEPVRDFYSDERLIRSILQNLVENSVKYRSISTQAWINISVKKSGKTVIIRIADNGIGIKEELQERVFDMFFRGTDSAKGSGLGLYILKNAVDKLGGRIELASKEMEGTELNIFLPDEADARA